MLAGQIEIQLLANIARLSKDMNEAKRTVGGAMDSIEKSVDRAKMAFGGLAGMLGARELIRMTDEYTKFTAQLRLATTSTNEYATAYANVKRISKDAQAELGSTGILYARIANGTRELGLSQSKVTDITETVSLALKASGATAQESASAMLQLSQAFGSGVLRGQEFNAVNEAAPRLMKALADGMGVAVGSLRGMAEAGKLTSAVMAEALPRALEDLRKEAASVQTISGAFIVLKNNVMEFVGQQAQASGAVSALTSGIGLLANNLETLAAVAIGLGVSKLAQVMIGVSAETYKATAGAMGYVAAQQAQRAATIASAQAELAKVESSLAGAVATRTAIALSREETLAKLGLARSDIAAAQAAMAASSAAGAQSFALRVLKESTEQLTVAEARRAAMVTELAVLGQQQARVSAQLTAATAAQAAAQTALGTATGTSLGVMSRALGLLGGPIGAITTLLGLGATAWMLWGSKAKESSEIAAESFLESSAKMIKALDEEIKRNERLISLRKHGATLEQANKNESRLAEIEKGNETLRQIDAGAGDYAQLNATERFFEREKVMGRILELARDTQKAMATGEQAKQANNATKLEEWLAKNKTYLDDAEKLTAAIKEAKAELGDAFNSDVENRIRAQFSKKGDKAANKELEEQAKLLAELSGLSGSFAEDWARLSTVHAAGKISTEQLTQAQAELLEKQPAIKKMLDEQAAALKAVDKANIEASQAHEKYVASLEEGLEKLRKEVEKQREHNDHLGLTKEAIAALDAAKLEEQATTLDGIAIKRLDRDLDEGVYKLYKDQAEELRKLARLKREGGAKEGSLEKEKKALEEAQKVMDNFRENIQRNLGDDLFNMLDGNFDNIGQSFKRMVLRMIADAASADLMNALMGKGKGAGSDGLGQLASLGANLIGMFTGSPSTSASYLADADAAAGLMSMDGGGFTGNGPRSGGMDGKGGFLAMMHPQETVIDHTKGQSGGGNVNVKVNIIGAPSKPQVTQSPDGRTIEVIFETVKNGIAEDIASGTGAVYGAIKNRLDVKERV